MHLGDFGITVINLLVVIVLAIWNILAFRDFHEGASMNWFAFVVLLATWIFLGVNILAMDGK